MRITDETIKAALKATEGSHEKADLRLFSEFSAYRPKRTRITYAAAIGIPAAALLVGAGIYTVHSGGYFRDVKNGFGTVTSTVYEAATDEITVSAHAEGSVIKLTLVIPKLALQAPDSFPYSEFDVMRVSGCTVECGGEKVKVADMPYSERTQNGAELEILLDSEIPAGEECTVTITSFEGGKKADQSMPIYGNWEIKL